MWWRKKDKAALEEQDNGGPGKVDEIEIWIEGLKHEERSVRLEAAEVLGRIGDARAVEPLIRAIVVEQLEIRVTAITALGKLGDTRAVEPLIKLLEDEEWTVRRNAAEALGKIGDIQAVEPLIQAINDWAIRENAVRALGKIGDARAIAPLIETLEDKSVKIRAATAETLGKIGDTRAILPLIMMLGDEYPVVRNCAEEAIEKRSHAQAIEPLIRALGEKNPDVRKEAAKILGKIGDARAAEPLIEIIDDRDRGVRENVIEALGKIGDVRAIEPLIPVLGVWDNQWTAAKALDNLGWKPEKDIEKAYYFLAKKQVNPLVALGTLAITPLEELLRKSNLPSFAKEGAIEALKKIYASIDAVIFGHAEFKPLNARTILLNPDVTELAMSMSNLQRVVIHTKTYNFHLVERFITYAVNYIGQKHLKEHVEVNIYGDPDKLHPNLRNGFENLCKCVEVHGGD